MDFFVFVCPTSCHPYPMPPQASRQGWPYYIRPPQEATDAPGNAASMPIHSLFAVSVPMAR
jgi:hypothetical protein